MGLFSSDVSFTYLEIGLGCNKQSPIPVYFSQYLMSDYHLTTDIQLPSIHLLNRLDAVSSAGEVRVKGALTLEMNSFLNEISVRVWKGSFDSDMNDTHHVRCLLNERRFADISIPFSSEIHIRKNKEDLIGSVLGAIKGIKDLTEWELGIKFTSHLQIHIHEGIRFNVVE